MEGQPQHRVTSVRRQQAFPSPRKERDWGQSYIYKARLEKASSGFPGEEGEPKSAMVKDIYLTIKSKTTRVWYEKKKKKKGIEERFPGSAEARLSKK